MDTVETVNGIEEFEFQSSSDENNVDGKSDSENEFENLGGEWKSSRRGSSAEPSDHSRSSSVSRDEVDVASSTQTYAKCEILLLILWKVVFPISLVAIFICLPLYTYSKTNAVFGVVENRFEVVEEKLEHQGIDLSTIKQELPKREAIDKKQNEKIIDMQKSQEQLEVDNRLLLELNNENFKRLEHKVNDNTDTINILYSNYDSLTQYVGTIKEELTILKETVAILKEKVESPPSIKTNFEKVVEKLHLDTVVEKLHLNTVVEKLHLNTVVDKITTVYDNRDEYINYCQEQLSEKYNYLSEIIANKIQF